MCRLRIPGGELKGWQLRGIADLAAEHGGGFLDVTTRANLQIREIPADQGCAVHEGLCDLGIINKGSRGGQRPERHLLRHRRLRPRRADRHAPAGEGDAPLHPEPPRALRNAAEVQHQLRGGRRVATLEDTERHRLPGGPRSGRPGLGRAFPKGSTPPDARGSRGTRTSPATPASCSPSEECVGVARRHPAGLHRPRRPDRPQQGPPQVRSRRLGVPEVHRSGRTAARPPAAKRSKRTAMSSRPLPTAGPTSASIARSRRGAVVRRTRPSGRPPDLRAGAGPSPRSPTATARAGSALTVWRRSPHSRCPRRRPGDRPAGGPKRSAWSGALVVPRRGSSHTTGNAGCKFAASNTKSQSDAASPAISKSGSTSTSRSTSTSPAALQQLRAALHRRHRLPRRESRSRRRMVEGYEIVVGAGIRGQAERRPAALSRRSPSTTSRRSWSGLIASYLDGQEGRSRSPTSPTASRSSLRSRRHQFHRRRRAEPSCSCSVHPIPRPSSIRCRHGCLNTP